MRRFIYSTVIGVAVLGLGWAANIGAQPFMSRPPITRPPIVNPYLGTIVNLNPVVLNPNFQAGLMLRNMYLQSALSSYYLSPYYYPNYYSPYYYPGAYYPMMPYSYPSPGYSSSYTAPATGYSSDQPYSSGAKKVYPETGTDIGVNDDYFQPRTLTTTAGATVRWHNHGYHRHTISADDGSWDSGELAVNDVFKYTFTQPGTYHYHCRIHGQTMAGTVIVR